MNTFPEREENYLDKLEARSIHILREAYATSKTFACFGLSARTAPCCFALREKHFSDMCLFRSYISTRITKSPK
jgi:hypothetical protein